MALSEISCMLRHVRRFVAPKRVRTPLAQFPSASYTVASPRGNVLIMSPWNYPFMLAMDPLADAIAAGNTAIVKPSAYAPATAALVEEIITACFDPAYVAVVTGGREENAALLQLKFDLVFFTGSQAVGREVLRHAAEHLTPAVLELGGKSPCIVDATADIPLAAKRIVFGKLSTAARPALPRTLSCAGRVSAENCRRRSCGRSAASTATRRWRIPPTAASSTGGTLTASAASSTRRKSSAAACGMRTACRSHPPS